MNRIYFLSLTLALLLPFPVSAQEISRPDQSEAAHLFAYYPKEGMQAKFDEGYRRHLAWHRENQDTLVWYAWYVAHGERTGLFIDGSFGRPFAAFDARVDPAGDRADFAQTTAPFADPAFRSAYVLRRDLSTGHPLEEERPSPNVQVSHYRLRPGTEVRFERAVVAARKVLMRMDNVPEHTWYELVTGGEQPTYMLMVARERWADYDRFHMELSDLIAYGYELDETERLLEAVSSSVEKVLSETWRYRPDLSYFPDR